MTPCAPPNLPLFLFNPARFRRPVKRFRLLLPLNYFYYYSPSLLTSPLQQFLSLTTLTSFFSF